MAIDKLTDSQIRNVRPREKTFRIHDGLGLYLEVTPTGNRWWRVSTAPRLQGHITPWARLAWAGRLGLQ